MAQTFSQLIRIHKDIAVKYEIKVIPEQICNNDSKTLRWFKHEHWQETLQLLHPVVQSRVFQESLSNNQQQKPNVVVASTIKGNGVTVVFLFKPSYSLQCLAPSSKPDFAKDVEESKKAKEVQYADLGGPYSRYKIYAEKLVAAVCLNDNHQSIPESKQSVLLNELDDQDVKSRYFVEKSCPNVNKSSSLKDSAVYTCTESITCHQDVNSNSISLHNQNKSISDKEISNKGKVKALSSCQLGNKHKCRSSAVKLSPASAIAQENIAVEKKKIDLKNTKKEICSKSKTKPLDQSAFKSIKKPTHVSGKSKLSLKRCLDSMLDIDRERNGSPLKRTKKIENHDNQNGSVESSEENSSNSKSVASQLSKLCSNSADSPASSLVTSTESVTCTVIDQNGKKNVTSPKCIRLVNKILSNRSPEKASIVSKSLDFSSQSPSLDGICQDDHQKEVTKMFDQLIAHSVADSSHSIVNSQKNMSTNKLNNKLDLNECSEEQRSCDKPLTACQKMDKRRHSFVKLFKKHGLQISPEVKINDPKNQILETTVLPSAGADLSRDYNCLKLKLKSVRNLKDLTEHTLNQWFNFNDYYLKGIYERKIYCRRHEDFYKGGRCRLKLNYEVNLCLLDEEQLDFIMDHLMEIFSGEKNTETTDYLLKVMLPEVLIKIFMDVNGIDHETSEQKMSEINNDKSQLAAFME